MWVLVTEPGGKKEEHVLLTAEPPLQARKSVLAYISLDYANIFLTVFSMNEAYCTFVQHIHLTIPSRFTKWQPPLLKPMEICLLKSGTNSHKFNLFSRLDTVLIRHGFYPWTAIKLPLRVEKASQLGRKAHLTRLWTQVLILPWYSCKMFE